MVDFKFLSVNETDRVSQNAFRGKKAGTENYKKKTEGNKKNKKTGEISKSSGEYQK